MLLLTEARQKNVGNEPDGNFSLTTANTDIIHSQGDDLTAASN